MSSVQYSALTRLLSHNTRVHDLEETLKQMNAPLVQVAAADEGVDLLVAGGYGHTRWRELVLGDVTRHLLDYMTMPVLMSH